MIEYIIITNAQALTDKNSEIIINNIHEVTLNYSVVGLGLNKVISLKY